MSMVLLVKEENNVTEEVSSEDCVVPARIDERKVKGYVDESVERFCDEDVGTVGDECDFVGVGRRDIVSGQDIMVEQRHLGGPLNTVLEVLILLFRGCIYGRDIALTWFIRYFWSIDHISRNPPPRFRTRERDVLRSALSVAAPVALDQAPVRQGRSR
ncbi:hypothetical protein Tco_0536310 [Tanacetum coccineum]